MSRFNHKKELSTRDVFYQVVVAIAAIAVVVYFSPREGRSNYQFDLNRPWRSSPLIATFDFPIYKNDATIKKEQDSIMRLYEPYFELDRTVEGKQIEKLRDAFRTNLKEEIPEYYRLRLEEKLHDIYKRGIATVEDINMLQQDSIHYIRIFTNNEAITQNSEEIFSHKAAYEYLINETDTARYNRFKLQRCNLNEYIAPNLLYDKQKSEAEQSELLSSISYAKGMVLSGQKIVDRGEIVDQHTYNILDSFEKESKKRSDSSSQITTMLIGQFIYVSLLTLCLMLYFTLFRKDYLENVRSVMMLFTLPIIFPLLTSFLVKQNILSVFIIPYAMAPIFIRVFMDSRTAFITHVFIILVSAIGLKYPFDFAVTQILAGMIAIYSLRELSQRSQLLRSALLVTLASLVFYFSMDLIHEKDISRIEPNTYIYIIINGMLLLFAYPVLFLFEKLFGFISNVTLVELSNINNDIMRKMSEVAPGTFQHSMQVSNLAAEVANKIGAKSQLVRTGALYHDIGKTCNPAFFTENQSSINPHDRLTFDDSAKIIINHVKDGLKLAEKHNLPQIIKDFITTHHGHGKTKYFYISYKNKFPDTPIDEDVFTYPGHNPNTLEQAILMMADAVEAASRSLPEYTEESISNLVEKIIDSQIEDGNFKECPITFLDITTAKEVFKEKLKTIYHTRISYPTLKNK